jgi:serine/threonine protein kinase
VTSLKYLHSHKVIHRDLKLGNLFINHHMQVKVGDFGLATKLTRMDERKKTICGTPNYIAPEILEGKNGHSFEVDIWSTGVILYTLLVGKPPFEAKDVKSTYKRIVANQYSFPDHTVVSPEAKDLIRFMLQPRPEKRPNLEQLSEHSFFTGPDAYCPTALPESCLREAPAQSKMASGDAASMRPANDENDPGALNRGYEQPLLNVKVGASSRPVLGERPSSAANSRPTSATTAQRSRPSSATTAGSGYALSSSGKVATANAMPLSVAPGMSGDRMPSSSSSSSAVRRTSGGSRETYSTSTNTAAITSSKGPYQQNFDIYQDLQQNNSGRIRSSSSKSTGSSFGSRQSGFTTAEDISTNTYGTAFGTSTRTSINHASEVDKEAMDVEQINAGFQQVQISNNRPAEAVGAAVAVAPAAAWGAAAAASDASPAPAAATSQRTQVGTPKGAATSTLGKPMDTLETMHKMLNRNVSASEREAATANGYMAAHAAAAATMTGGDGRMDSPDQRASPACDDSIDVVAVEEKQHGASSSVDRNSARSSVNTEEDAMGIQEMLSSQQHTANGTTSARDLSKATAKVWVVRYVDYTSKYGLGFLLNTGSAGVYFNDSTKIVLSADGTIFQYIERRRRDGGSSSSSEHLTQTHYMSAYPQELQKKVTLLRHFRNYLVDQQRTYGESGSEGGDKATASSASDLPTLLPENSSTGATPTIKFGVSSAAFDAKDAVEMGLNAEGNLVGSNSSDGEMPFLKKWVRTRHAILFRLSNRVVQVVFFDRSEVLLSPEARVVTYVNKSGEREEHSLEDVLDSGRSDISKRLKYTKDIIWRLINVSNNR